jgi:hypothetical protein
MRCSKRWMPEHVGVDGKWCVGGWPMRLTASHVNGLPARSLDTVTRRVKMTWAEIVDASIFRSYVLVCLRRGFRAI